MANLNSSVRAGLLGGALAIFAPLALAHHGAEGGHAVDGLDPTTAEKIDAALAGDHRSDSNKARDAYRNPKETLAFFGLRSDMSVVEISPGGGWYSEILGPVLAEDGVLYAAQYDINNTRAPFFRGAVATFLTKLVENPDVYASTKITTFDPPTPLTEAAPEPVDMVLSFRNVHNWMGGGFEADAFQAFYDILKPGGVLGVVEHRLPEDRDQPERARTGYVKESLTIEMAEAAGFEFVAASDVNNNPADTADHPRGVWTLAPTLAMGDETPDGIREIGESDRYTLKFVKPQIEAAANTPDRTARAAAPASNQGGGS
ncbi:MAG: class I SAM-dependent methyltransferase [Maricaulaceae bacterium]